MNICSHCGGTHWWPFDGNDISCAGCGYVKKGGSNRDDLYAEVMAAVPGMPLPARSERHGVEVRRARDITLAEEAAKRHGVSLRDVWADMRCSKSITGPIRFALQSIIADLAVAGLGSHRIALALHRSTATIKESSGWARGRAKNHE